MKNVKGFTYTSPTKHGKSTIVQLAISNRKSIGSVATGARHSYAISIPYGDEHYIHHHYGHKEEHFIKRYNPNESFWSIDFHEAWYRSLNTKWQHLNYEEILDHDMCLNPQKAMGYLHDINQKIHLKHVKNKMPFFKVKESTLEKMRRKTNIIGYRSNPVKTIEQILKYSRGYTKSTSIEDWYNMMADSILVNLSLTEEYPKLYKYYDIPYVRVDIDDWSFYERVTKWKLYGRIKWEILNKYPNCAAMILNIDVDHYVNHFTKKFLS